MQNLLIEPPFWWCGMKNSHLQLLIHSDNNINHIIPKINSPDVALLEVVLFSNPHYMAIYLDLTNAKPQTLNIDFNGEIIKYELKKRDPNSDKIQGFDSSDVLYLLMPDRFARSSTEPSEIDSQIGISAEEAIENGIKIQAEREKERKAKVESTEKLTSEKVDNNDDGFVHRWVENADKYEKFIDPITKTERVKYKFDRQDPNARHGGNIRGIIDKLDYLFDLGVTAIWLNPIFDNDMPDGSYHGYASTDFYSIDPRFGSDSDLIELIEKIHAKGNKFVMDVVFNHCGSNHIWFRDQPCSDWFNYVDKGIYSNHEITSTFSPYSSKIDWEEFNSGCFVSTMPDLNQRNQHLGTYLRQNSIWWIEHAHINGIRLDTYPYCNPDFMRGWIDEVMNEYPNFNIVGETWVENPVGVAYWQKGNPYSNNNLPTIMDFSFSLNSRVAFKEETADRRGLALMKEHLNYDFVYPDVFHLLRFLDNHDTVRFIAEKPENTNIFRKAVTFLLTVPGIPQLYYGTEILMYGNRESSDGYVRLDFPGGWKNDKQNCFTREGRTKLQNEAFDFIRKLLNWRKGNEIISKGTMTQFRPQNGVYLYQRKYNGKSVVVVMNGTDSQKLVHSMRYKEILTEEHLGTDIFTSREFDFSYNFVLEPQEVLVLEMHK